jgi:hypothetical protein
MSVDGKTDDGLQRPIVNGGKMRRGSGKFKKREAKCIHENRGI